MILTSRLSKKQEIRVRLFFQKEKATQQLLKVYTHISQHNRMQGRQIPYLRYLRKYFEHIVNAWLGSTVILQLRTLHNQYFVCIRVRWV